jgi:hypothetical protein
MTAWGERIVSWGAAGATRNAGRALAERKLADRRVDALARRLPHADHDDEGDAAA